jgi:hypothetical protein
MAELAVLSDSPKEDRAWWSLVTHVEEDGHAVNGGSRRRWPATWATTGCKVTRGRWWTRLSTRMAMEGDGGGARR